MRKLMMILVMLLVASGVNAQSKKQKTVQKDNMYAVKQAALNAVKRSLIAPSQFILTDYNGNRIGVNGIEIISHSNGLKSVEWSDSAYFYNGNKWTFRDKFDDEEPDSIWVYKMVQEPIHSYYLVRVIGDARNRAGGYEQIIKKVYVYGKASGFYGTMNELKPDVKKYHLGTIVCEKKVKKEKSVEESREEYEKKLFEEGRRLMQELEERNIDLEYTKIGKKFSGSR